MNGHIEAGDSNDIVVFANAIPILVPNATFSGDINNLTLQGAGGITSLGDLSINGILNLQAANPSSTKGILDMFDGTNLKTLNMKHLATTIGIGDVTGIVRRTSFNPNTNYTFGNQFTYVSFRLGGTYPTEMNVKIQIGEAPAWQTATTPIQRIYDFIQTGGVDCIASITSHYLDSELNGNTELSLEYWTFGANGQQPAGAFEWGGSAYNNTNNWVTLNNVLLGSFPNVFGNLEYTLAAGSDVDLIWNGLVSTEWLNLNNWTPQHVPDATSNIVIPDATTTPNDPTLAISTSIFKMTLQTNAILNGSSNSSLTILGDNGAWDNQGGTFNPDTSTVTFNNPIAVIGGTTNFYNLVIPVNYSLTMLSNSHIGIAGALTNNGIFNIDAVSGTTVEYNGGNQTVINPAPLDPINNHYHDLILSGTGTKTLPSSPLDIHGSMFMLGSAVTTVNELFTIDGNLNLSGTSEITYNVNSSIDGDMTISNGAKMVLNADKSLSVAGTIANTVGTSGIVLKSNSNGTASLYHQTDNVPATVERYISGAKEDWHFLSSPVSNQEISGTWLPSGTYGNGTGYDLYVWDEGASCWVYQKNIGNTEIPYDPKNPNWPTVHPSANFVPGRGYLYSVQALNPTKEFVGNLNNGFISYPITNNSTATDLKGFNLVGNPYPSSMDWKAGSGWSRTNLITTDGSYDMWIWNPLANNYGVYNSVGSTGTNSVTQYIPPMQGFFVRAASNGSFGMSNLVRVNEGASNWMKSSNIKNTRSNIKVQIASNSGFGSDEVLLLFGYSSNEVGAAKLFSTTKTAPSAYLKVGKEELSVRYLTNATENPIVPLMFKPGSDGNYNLNIGLDYMDFDYVILEDKKTKTFHSLLENPIYQFKGLLSDDPNRFILHFTPDSEVENELSSQIYYDGNEIVVDLTLIDNKTEVKIVDMLGRLLLSKTVEGNSIHRFQISKTNQILIVIAKSENKIKRSKVLIY